MPYSTPTAEASLNSTVICSKLSAALPGKSFLPGSSEYNSSVESYFFRTARQTPSCILEPKSAEDVKTIVAILAANPGVKFAIRSGGHTPNPNQSNIEDGVTIDLRGLKGVETKQGQDDILSVGTGAEWGDVYDYLEGTGRAAVGSRESSVGVGGFITGGE
jgi:FAD/FMN-containing dehydrogenase